MPGPPPSGDPAVNRLSDVSHERGRPITRADSDRPPPGSIDRSGAQTAQRQAGRPPVGLANGWFYKAASRKSAFFDITQGNNDLAGVGCCQATVGYDLASGLGVPNWAILPATLPPPG